MKAILLSLATAVAWGLGGYFEKKGLQLGNLPAQVGITLRTGVALLILGAVSFPHWRAIPQAGTKSLAMVAIGGGVLAGAVGMLCFYTALKSAPLGKVMPIAFTAPLFGVLAGVLFGGEALGLKEVLGILLTTGGIILLTT